MTAEDVIQQISLELGGREGLTDGIISDALILVLNYINRPELPEELESFVRKKVQQIIDYAAEFGDAPQTVQSVSSGDMTVTYAVSGSSHNDVYGLSASDKTALQAFRRLRR